jgi:hypothetical protein
MGQKWQKAGRSLENSLLIFNVAWGNTIDTMVKQYRVTAELGQPVTEIPSQLIGPIYRRFLKNTIEESPAVASEINLEKGAMYYTEDAKTKESMGEHPVTSTAMISFLCEGKVKLVDYMFQPVVRMSKEEDSKFLGGKYVRGMPSDDWLDKPFKRYMDAGFPPKIFTWKGEEVNLEEWTWNDHIQKVIKNHELWYHLYSKSNFSY